MKPALLLSFIRDGLSEQEHYGFIKVLNTEKVLFAVGDAENTVFYQRSCAKPLQASLLVDFKIADYYNLTQEEIAVSCASHVGEAEHVEVIKNYLNKIECTKDELLCGIQQPIGISAREDLIKQDKKPDILQNNCSGKHTFMLAACQKYAWDKASYPQQSHTLQMKILEKIKELCQTNKELPVTKDGCGAPIWATTLDELGKGYLNLFTNPKYSKIKEAFQNHPYLIGGKGRLDSEIINADKNLIAKVGAGGLCVVVNLKKQEALVVKSADADIKARTLITIFALLDLGWLKDEQIQNSGLKQIFQTETTTLHGEIIGKAIPEFNLSKI